MAQLSSQYGGWMGAGDDDCSGRDEGEEDRSERCLEG